MYIISIVATMMLSQCWRAYNYPPRERARLYSHPYTSLTESGSSSVSADQMSLCSNFSILSSMVSITIVVLILRYNICLYASVAREQICTISINIQYQKFTPALTGRIECRDTLFPASVTQEMGIKWCEGTERTMPR